MNVMIIGCERVGANLAAELCKTGYDVVIVDRSAKNFQSLPAFFKGITVQGVAMDVEVLERAGIRECEAFAAVTGDDNLNIIAAQLAKDLYGVPNVIARISDPIRERVFENSGLKTVCPTNIEQAGLYNLITGEKYDSIVNFGNRKARFTTRYFRGYEGKRICDIPVFEGEMVYAVVSSDGKLSLADDRGRVIAPGEGIVVTSLAD